MLKLMSEVMFRDLCVVDVGMEYVVFCYFNVVGCDLKGWIG